jgi:hypothetical protein
MYFLADKVASHRKDPELLNKHLLDEADVCWTFSTTKQIRHSLTQKQFLKTKEKNPFLLSFIIFKTKYSSVYLH